MQHEPARTFPDAIVTGICMDCGDEFSGPLAVRFIATPEGPALEIDVLSETTHELHALARVGRALIPTVTAGNPLPRVGQA